MSNPFSYCELHTNDPAGARAFYGALFDWKLETQKTPWGEYTEIKTADGPEGGLMKSQDGGSHWLTYVRVADLVSSTAKARQLGAKVLQEKVEVADVGWFSLLQDPTGATFAMWEKKVS